LVALTIEKPRNSGEIAAFFGFFFFELLYFACLKGEKDAKIIKMVK
jgi:hypothetical protein